MHSRASEKYSVFAHCTDCARSARRRTYPHTGRRIAEHAARLVAVCDVCGLAIVEVAAAARHEDAGPLSGGPLERIAGGVEQAVLAHRRGMAGDLVGAHQLELVGR